MSVVVPGLEIDGFRAAFFGALIISIISWLLNIFVAGDGKLVFIKRAGRDGDSR